MKIIVRNNDPLKAFKLLNRKLHQDNIFIELKERQFFKTKGEKRREKKKRAVARQRKEQAKRELILQKLENQVARGNNGRRNNRKPSTNRVGSANSSRNTQSKAPRANS
jgi:ribosomal protein S21